MKNYIITNCPAYLKYNKCFHNGHCDNITDCVMKRIIDECKDMASDEDFYAYDFAKEILQLLEIEEVDE